MGRPGRRLPPCAAILVLAPLLWVAGAAGQTGPAADPAADTAGHPAHAGEADGPQRPAGHRLAIEVAGLLHALDDRMASPVRYSGTGVAVGAGWSGRTGLWQWDVRGAFARPRLTSRLTTDAGGFEDTAWGALSADLLRRFWHRPRGSLWAGPGVAAELGIRRHVYVHETWLNFRSAFVALQAAVRGELGVGRGRVTATLALPVLGLSVRKEYAGVIRRGPAVEVAFPPFLAARYRLAYGRPLWGSLGLRVFHDASLIRHAAPELASLAHRLGAALVWRPAP